MLPVYLGCFAVAAVFVAAVVGLGYLLR